MSSKPFFYRITAADYLAAIVTVPEADRGQWALDLALDMVAGNADTAKSEFAKSIILEAQSFSDKKREAANKRWSNKHKQTDAEDMQIDAVHKHSNASNNNRSSTITETETKEEQQPGGGNDKFYKMKDLSAMAVRYLGWKGNLSPGQAEQLRPLTDIFKADVDFGFKAAASANAGSVAYVIKAAGNNTQAGSVDTTEFEKALKERYG